jgi:hypothetical protein
VGPPAYPGGLPALDVDIRKAPFCSAVANLFAHGQTKGVFQLEEYLGQKWSKMLKPENEEHICALVSLLRPGCLKARDSNGVSMTEHYVLRKNGDEQTESLHPVVDEVLAKTYNVVVFQEQICKLSEVVAGFSKAEAQLLRKAAGKKDAQLMADTRLKFLERAKEYGAVPYELAVQLFDWIQESARYSFNKCASEDTIIVRYGTGGQVKGVGYTVGHMYRIRNDIRYAQKHGHDVLRRKWMRLGHYGQGLSMCEDGRVRPNLIRDIQPAGYRPVFRLTTSDGQSVRLTGNHKVPTTDGELTVAEIARRVLLGMEVVVFRRGEYEKGNGKRYNFSKYTNETRPYVEGRFVNGAFGENNYAYTGGGFTSFKAVKATKAKVCELCGKTEGRLEMDHIDGDRSNNEPENLQLLCVSCHKKKEYACGRVKRGEKGAPRVETRVVSVEPDGECETYDVTMDAPNHNFVVNDGLVVCNSHAYSYGCKAVKTAYLKAHFPLAFYANWLALAFLKGKKKGCEEEASLLVNDARSANIKVRSPDVRTRSARVDLDGDAAVFGLCDVSGVGDGHVEKMVEAIQAEEESSGKPLSDWTWTHFLLKVGTTVPVKVMEGLAYAGAFAHFSVPRLRQANEAKCVARLKSKKTVHAWLVSHAGEADSLAELIRSAARPKKEGGAAANKNTTQDLLDEAYLLDHPPTSEADTPRVIAELEEKALGVPVTYTKLAGADVSGRTAPIKDLLDGRKEKVRVCAVLKSSRAFRTKKGRDMAWLTLGDESGSLNEIVCFPDDYEKHRALLRDGNVLQVALEPSRRGDGFVATEFWQI